MNTKNYPVIVMILAHMVGGILWFYGNFVSQQEMCITNVFIGTIVYRRVY